MLICDVHNLIADFFLVRFEEGAEILLPAFRKVLPSWIQGIEDIRQDPLQRLGDDIGIGLFGGGQSAFNGHAGNAGLGGGDFFNEIPALGDELGAGGSMHQGRKVRHGAILYANLVAI